MPDLGDACATAVIDAVVCGTDAGGAESAA